MALISFMYMNRLDTDRKTYAYLIIIPYSQTSLKWHLPRETNFLERHTSFFPIISQLAFLEQYLFTTNILLCSRNGICSWRVAITFIVLSFLLLFWKFLNIWSYFTSFSNFQVQFSRWWIVPAICRLKTFRLHWLRVFTSDFKDFEFDS